MKQLQKSDLKKGEIYWFVGSAVKFLNKISNTNINEHDCYLYNTTFYPYKGENLRVPVSILKATPEEKHWLKVCIEANKFVSYEDAMKTFIPEYVECINLSDWRQTIKENNGNLIFKSDFKSTCSVQILEVLPQSKHFKPSTKEAYDAQFKKSEFVLPEIWWVRITQENLEDVCEFLGFELNEKGIGNIVGMCKHYRTGKIEKGWNPIPTTVYGSTFGDEITTEQFRKYVLKKQDENTSKFINDTTVINKEGEVFKVGDIIKSINSNLKDKIIDFRWKNDKSEICAVLPNIPNGIGIDKIELCVEPKVEPKQELSLLEQAKLRYPIGTKFRVAHMPHIICKVKDHENYYFQTDEIINLNIEVPIDGCFGGCVYYKGKWAEIVDDFVLPEKWCIKDVKEVKEFFENYNHGGYTCSNNAYLHYPRIVNKCYFKEIQKDYTEITFEQFKKYVLNETL